MGTVWAGPRRAARPRGRRQGGPVPAGSASRSSADLRERTLREARATARLSHPNVVTTYDVVEEDGRPWIVMELLPSRSLERRAARGRPAAAAPGRRDRARRARRAEAAHAQGVVHRDVKPGNVLITPTAAPVLTDFGIATMAGDPAAHLAPAWCSAPPPTCRPSGPAAAPRPARRPVVARRDALRRGRGPAAVRRDNALGDPDRRDLRPGRRRLGRGPLRGASSACCERPADRASSPPCGPAAGGGGRPNDRGDRTGRDRRPGPCRPHRGVAGRRVDPRTPPGGPDCPTAAPTPYAVLGRRRRRTAGGRPRPRTAAGRRDRRVALLSGGGDKPASRRPRDDAVDVGRAATSTSPPASSTSPPPSDHGVPAGYHLYATRPASPSPSPTGGRRASGTAAVDFGTGRGRFLRIDQTDPPKADPDKDWEEQEKSVRQGLPGYHRISIEASTTATRRRPTGSSPSAATPMC